MLPLWLGLLLLLGSSVLAGVFGSLLGLGGGIIVVPVLTLGFDLEIRYAIGASVVCIVATSSGAAAAYVRDHLTNLRVAMFLETGTAVGALVGALLAGVINQRVLYLLFGGFLALSGAMMLRRRVERTTDLSARDRLADRLKLHDSFPDATGQPRPYRVRHTASAWAMMVVAGVASGLLGIGSGALKVPAMDVLMRLPMKVSSATSSFMIGVTASTGAAIYFVRGDVLPEIAGPVALGVVGGSFLGARLLPHVKSRWLRWVFVVVLGAVAIQMLLKGVL